MQIAQVKDAHTTFGRSDYDVFGGRFPDFLLGRCSQQDFHGPAHALRHIEQRLVLPRPRGYQPACARQRLELTEFR
ncbi:MAG: hypothetical protein ACREA0_10030 [bacterium]